jgi:signal transduction histidine kinase
LGRAITNVIENALQAMPNHGSLLIHVKTKKDSVHIITSDTGIGMDGNELKRVFEPYFSTKTSGTGLGLTIARRNIELNRGTVSVTSEKGGGTTVTFYLPIEKQEPETHRFQLA